MRPKPPQELPPRPLRRRPPPREGQQISPPPRQQQRRPSLWAYTHAACPSVPPVACPAGPPGRIAPNTAGVLFTALLPDTPANQLDLVLYTEVIRAAAAGTNPTQPPTITVAIVAPSGSSADGGGPCTQEEAVTKGGSLVATRVDFDAWWADGPAATCFRKGFQLEVWLEEEGRMEVLAAAPAWLQGAFGPNASVQDVRSDTPLSAKPPPPPPPKKRRRPD